jgi:hypothetical protein
MQVGDEETLPKLLTTGDTGEARPYRPSVSCGVPKVKRNNFFEGTYIFRDSIRRRGPLFLDCITTPPKEIHNFTITIVYPLHPSYSSKP